MGTPISGNSYQLFWTPILPTPGTEVELTDGTTDIEKTDEYDTEDVGHRGNTAATLPGAHTFEVNVSFIATSEANSLYKRASLQPTDEGTTGTLRGVPQGEATVGGQEWEADMLVVANNHTAAVGGGIEGELSFRSIGPATYSTVA
jgi:hypothetical protein